MKALKIFVAIIGSILGLVLIGVVAAFVLLRQPSGIASKVTPVASSPQAVQSFENKWTEFNNVIKEAKPGTQVTMNVTQEEITSKVNEELKSIKLPEGLAIGNVTINLQDGKALVSADVKYSALQGIAGMEINVATVNGTPSIVVKDVDMGALPIPQALKDQLIGIIPNSGVISLGNLPVDITGIQIVNGQLVMAGVTK